VESLNFPIAIHDHKAIPVVMATTTWPVGTAERERITELSMDNLGPWPGGKANSVLPASGVGD